MSWVAGARRETSGSGTSCQSPRPRVGRDEGRGGLLRLWGHVRREISHDFDGHGRGEMRISNRDGGGIHRFERLKLFDADTGLAGSSGEKDENAASGRSVVAVMNAQFREFKTQAARFTHDLRHRSLIQTALRKYEDVRDKSKGAFQDWQAARQAASEIKWEAINHLDKYLPEFVAK